MKVMKPTAQQRRNMAKSHKALDEIEAEKKQNIDEDAKKKLWPKTFGWDDPDHARSDEQRTTKIKIEKDGTCKKENIHRKKGTFFVCI